MGKVFRFLFEQLGEFVCQSIFTWSWQKWGVALLASLGSVGIVQYVESAPVSASIIIFCLVFLVMAYMIQTFWKPAKVAARHAVTNSENLQMQAGWPIVSLNCELPWPNRKWTLSNSGAKAFNITSQPIILDGCSITIRQLSELDRGKTEISFDMKHPAHGDWSFPSIEAFFNDLKEQQIDIILEYQNALGHRFCTESEILWNPKDHELRPSHKRVRAV